MTRAEFITLLDKIQTAERVVSGQGQSEYAHDTDNCFANFDSDADHGVSRLQSIATHLNKHMRGIKAFVTGYRSQREDIRGRIKDARLYLALLWGAIEDEEWRAELAQQEFIEEMEGTPVPTVNRDPDGQGWLFGADPLEDRPVGPTKEPPMWETPPLTGPRYSDIVLAPPKKLD